MLDNHLKCTLIGDQGNVWHKADVNLPYVPGGEFRVLIEGVIGDGFKSDIAIDNVVYTPGPCTSTGTDTSKDTCYFNPSERSCSWKQVTSGGSYLFGEWLQDDLDFVVTHGATPSRRKGHATGPSGDHTPGQMGQGITKTPRKKLSAILFL